VPLGGVDVIEIDFVGNDGDARAGADPHRAPQAITGTVLNSGCMTVLSGALIHTHSKIAVIALSGGVVPHRVYAPLLADVIWQSQRGERHSTIEVALVCGVWLWAEYAETGIVLADRSQE
jgi:hypothetical protein